MKKGVHWEEIYGGKFMTMATWPPQANPPHFRGSRWAFRTVPPDYMGVEKTIDFIESRRNTGEPWLISVNPFDPPSAPGSAAGIQRPAEHRRYAAAPLWGRR